MRALQLHYTSCRRGTGSGAGFQTRAMSPGIAPDEQRELERRGGYRPPRDFPAEPGDEEIRRDFPRALRFQVLPSGRRAVILSCYAGRDYSGRWGNFFAHSLLFEAKEELPFWPIDLLEWPGWKISLPAAEDQEEVPPPLLVVEIGAEPPGTSFDLEELAAFLKEEPGRPELLARILRAIFAVGESSRPVVIRDTPTAALYWLACAQKLLPPRHAQALSSSTYQDDPRGCADLNATSGETDFSFDDTTRKFRFFVFDLTTGFHSEVPGSKNDYPALAARLLASEPQRLAAFFDFMRLFDHQRPEPALLAALHLFELSLGDRSHLSGTTLAAMIDFASRHATPQGKGRLLDILAAAVGPDVSTLSPADLKRWIEFLAQGAAASGKTQHRSAAISAWLVLLCRHLLPGQRGLEETVSSWRTLTSALSAARPEIGQRLLAEGFSGLSAQDLARLPAAILDFLLAATRDSLEWTRQEPLWEQPRFRALAAARLAAPGSLADAAEAVLSVLPGEPLALAALAGRLSDWAAERGGAETVDERKLAVGRGLGRRLAGLPAQAASATRARLDAESSHALLFGEWLERLERAAEPQGALAAYERDVLPAVPSYDRGFRPAIYQTLLRAVAVAERPILALGWLRAGAVATFPAEIAAECLASANLGLSLDSPDPQAEDQARLVAEEAKRRKLVLRPDRPLLRRALSEARGGQVSLGANTLGRVKEALVGIDASGYETFLAGLLVLELERVRNRSDHGQVLRALVLKAHQDVFVRRYHEFFRRKRKPPWPEPLQAALKLWLHLGGERRAQPELAELEPILRQGLLLALGKLSAKELESVRKKLKEARLDADASRMWGHLEQELGKRGVGGLWRRLMQMVGRGGS